MSARTALFMVLTPFTLAACGSGKTEATRGNAPTPPELTAANAPIGPTAQQLAVLDERDCGGVANAYVSAIERSDFRFAAQFWNDPVIDAARLKALYSDYVTPRIKIANMRSEGAAGSVFCTVSGVLSDASDPRIAPQSGEFMMRRVNDIDGATEQQLRWTIRTSSFVEPMERSSKGDPA